jgi:hypothetical protein
MAATGSVSPSAIAALARYTACDISDALLKLKVRGAGFLPDLTLFGDPSIASTQPDAAPSSVTIAPASTVLFTVKGGEVGGRGGPQEQQTAVGEDSSPDSRSHPPALPPSNIPAGTHWADLTEPGTIVILRQPDGQKNAVCGGIMAIRMKALRAKGIVVVGRARDLTELKATGLSVSNP